MAEYATVSGIVGLLTAKNCPDAGDVPPHCRQHRIAAARGQGRLSLGGCRPESGRVQLAGVDRLVECLLADQEPVRQFLPQRLEP
jgi:hypothetical protein